MEIKERPIILLMDDDKDIIQLIKRIFIDTFNIVGIDNSMSFINQIDDIKPNLILMDVNLDYMSGIELTSAIKSNPQFSHVPIVLFTARADAEKMFEKSEADALIKKPFDKNRLTEVVYSFL